jgi:hypothetical protein
MMRFVSLLAILLACVSTQAATTRVPEDQPTIQAGIDAAADEDTVLVADGVYTGSGNRDIDFKGKTVVLRSENGRENTTIDCQGSPAEPHRGFYFHSGETSAAVLEGFTIQGGYGLYDSEGESVGGAIKCDSSSSPLLTDCMFYQNRFGGKGGGVYCENSSPTLINCIFSENESDQISLGYGNGGGMYCENSSSILINCTFSNNATGILVADGGGMYCVSSSLTLNGCSFIGNRAADNGGRGGGIVCWSSSLTLNDCSLSENWANYGGGVACFGDSAALTNCVISNNYVFSDTWPEGGWGGGLYCHSSSVSLTGSTLSGNGNPWVGYHCYGGGLYLVSGSVSAENSIVAFCQGGMAVDGADYEPNLLCCDIYGNDDGDWINRIADQANIDGNISADPQFCDTAHDNYHIVDTSPCAPANNQCSTLIGAYDISCTCCVGITGNVDGDALETVDVGDLTALISYLYLLPDTEPTCMREANIDGDSQGAVDLGDLTHLIAYLYISPNPEPAPCP